MNVLLDVRASGPHFPGIGRYVDALRLHLPAATLEGERVRFLGDTRSAPWSHPDAGIRIRTGARSPMAGRSAARVLGGSDFDVFHAPWLNLVPTRSPVPVVLTVHDLIPVTMPHLSSLRARWLFPGRLQRALEGCRMVIVPSNRTSDDLLRLTGFDPGRVHVIPHAADGAFRPTAEAERPAVHSRLGRLGIDGPFVLTVSTDRPHKNLDRLVRAWSLVRSPVPTRLVIAGRGLDRARGRLEALFGSDGPRHGTSLTVIGDPDDRDLAALYASAEIVVCPSLYEGFGLPALEALACGAAVATSDGGSLAEVVGDAAALFRPEDVGAMARTIEDLLRRPEERERLRRAATDRAGHFSWGRSAALHLEVYRQAARPG